MDIFASLHQTIRVINELNWTDEARKADFMAEAAVVGARRRSGFVTNSEDLRRDFQLIGSVVRRYADSLFSIFASEIAQVEQSTKPISDDAVDWLSVASSKLGRKQKASVTPFNFRAEVCLQQ